MAITDLIPWKRKKQVDVQREQSLDVFQRDMNRMFDEFFDRTSWMRPFDWFGAEASFSPRLDVTEDEKTVKVSAELPGLSEDDVNVTLRDNMLTISGEKRAESEDKGDNYYRMERSYGAFHRSVVLPNEIDQDKVDAAFKNGVLTITLPKVVEDKPRKVIQVKTK